VELAKQGIYVSFPDEVQTLASDGGTESEETSEPGPTEAEGGEEDQR
jgi:hypothetical protein